MTNIAIGGSNPTGGRFNYSAQAFGSVTFTRAEEIPEPTTIAGVPVAIVLSGVYHRRLKCRSKPD